MKPEITHLDLYTFRINKDFKDIAQKLLGPKIPAICREAILSAVEAEKRKQEHLAKLKKPRVEPPTLLKRIQSVLR